MLDAHATPRGAGTVAAPKPQEPALAVTAEAVSQSRSMPILRYLDVVAVVIAAIPAIVLGAPTFGYLVGGGAWILQRLIQANEYRLAPHLKTPRAQLGAHLAEAFGRIWLLAIAIIVAGVAGGRADGLTCAIVIFGAYSIAFVIRVFSGPPQTRRPAA